MTTPIDVILRFVKTGQGDDQAVKALKDLERAASGADGKISSIGAASTAAQRKLSQLNNEVVNGTKSVKDAQREWRNYQKELSTGNIPKATTDIKSLATGALAVGAALGTAAIAAREAYELIGEGADLQLAERQFENLAESIGTTATALKSDLTAATKGMVAESQLVAGAAQLIDLGLARSHDQAVRLGAAVGALNLDMQVLGLTLANNSTARLDSLRLSMEDVLAIQKRLEAQGFQGDAFDEAVLIALEDKMGLLGDTSETAAGKLAILEAKAANAGDRLKLLTLSAVEATGALDALTRDRDPLEQNFVDANELAKQADSLEEYIDLLNEAGLFVPDRATAQAWFEQGQAITHAAESAGLFDEKVQQLHASQSGLSSATRTAVAEASAYDQALLQNYASTQQLLNANRELETAFGALDETAGDYFVDVLNGDLAQGNLNQKIFDSAAAAGASATELALLGGALGLYSEEAVEAALKTAIIQAEIDRLAQAYANGEVTVGQMTSQLNAFIAGLDDVGGQANYAGEQIQALSDKIGGLPSSHEFVIKITQDGEVPTLPTGPGSGQQAAAFAEGGPIGGGTPYTGPGADNVLIAAQTGEYMLKRSAVQKLGLNRLSYMNATGRLPGFADGGLVGDGGGGGSLAGASVMLQPIIQVSGVVSRQQGIESGRNILDGLVDAARGRGVRI